MEIRNLRPWPVEIPDLERGEVYECAARPGTVEVPDPLGKSLLKQTDAWTSTEKDKKSDKVGTTGKEA